MALSNAERLALHRERYKAKTLHEKNRQTINLRHALHKYIDRLDKTGLYAIAPILFWATKDLNGGRI